MKRSRRRWRNKNAKWNIRKRGNSYESSDNRQTKSWKCVMRSRQGEGAERSSLYKSIIKSMEEDSAPPGSFSRLNEVVNMQTPTCWPERDPVCLLASSTLCSDPGGMLRRRRNRGPIVNPVHPLPSVLSPYLLPCLPQKNVTFLHHGSTENTISCHHSVKMLW